MEFSTLELAKYLKDIRESLGYSIYDVNKLCEISPSYLSLMENGKRRPSPVILKKLSSIYHINYTDLLAKAGFSELIEDKNEGVMKTVDTFQRRLEKALILRNMKPVELHEKTGISESLLSKYLSNNAVARQKKLTLLADALNVNEVWLMGYDVPMEKETISNNDFRYANHNGINTEGLTADEVEEINQFVEFIKNKKKNGGK